MKNNRLKYGLIGCLFLPIACSAQHLYFHYTLFTQPQLIQSVLKSMVYVPGGTFRFGPKDGAHAQVTLSDFYMTKYTVTQQQYRSFLHLKHWSGQTVFEQFNDKASEGLYPAQPLFSRAQKFCHWIGQQVGLDITLPTEEQWEYAARSGGKDVKYSTNNGKIEPGANFPVKSSYTGPYEMHVNRFPPNPMGFYLMNANVSEWTRSCYKDYPRHTLTDPVDDIRKCKYFTVRGTGAYAVMTYERVPASNKSRKVIEKKALEVFNRTWATRPELQDSGGGFRCVINSGKKLDLAEVIKKATK